MLKAEYHSIVLFSKSQISTLPVANDFTDILNHKSHGKSLNVGFHTPVERKDFLYHPE